MAYLLELKLDWSRKDFRHFLRRFLGKRHGFRHRLATELDHDGVGVSVHHVRVVIVAVLQPKEGTMRTFVDERRELDRRR